ncbi:MAG: SOS response-associated peptidase family protein [Burkholderiales bacterium]|nr:SOS response-associated peptidase family protein [Burkholderiales bacterium]
MSSQYQSVLSPSLYPDAFQVAAPVPLPQRNVWPRQQGVFIRRVTLLAAGPAGEPMGDPAAEPMGGSAAEPAPAPGKGLRELVAGQFGFVPHWVKSASDARLRATKLVNARSETVSTSTQFRDAWLKGQRCIVPMMAFIEDDWRSGKAVPTRIARIDGKPMGAAGLWEVWSKDGEQIVSFTLLTVSANSHALLHRYQQDGNEKRMPAILGEGAHDAWLDARPEKAREFMRAYPATSLTANPVEK